MWGKEEVVEEVGLEGMVEVCRMEVVVLDGIWGRVEEEVFEGRNVVEWVEVDVDGE